MNASIGITEGVMMCDKEGCSSIFILNETCFTLSDLVTMIAEHDREAHKG